MAERGELPLLAWAAAQNANARALRRRRLSLLCIGTFACALLAAPVLRPTAPMLVWNASRSAPIGLYRVDPVSVVRRGDMVIARAPAAVRELAARRHYLPADVPLVKRVVAVPGDRVCAIGDAITIDGRQVARRRPADRERRPLPWWTGCTRLGPATLFLLMAEVPDSFDGRYFGPTPRTDVIGKAAFLWAR